MSWHRCIPKYVFLVPLKHPGPKTTTPVASLCREYQCFSSSSYCGCRPTPGPRHSSITNHFKSRALDNTLPNPVRVECAEPGNGANTHYGRGKWTGASRDLLQRGSGWIRTDRVGTVQYAGIVQILPRGMEGNRVACGSSPMNTTQYTPHTYLRSAPERPADTTSPFTHPSSCAQGHFRYVPSSCVPLCTVVSTAYVLVRTPCWWCSE